MYHTGDEAGAEKLARAAESAVEKMRAALGCVRASGFWTWENRLRVYVYPSRADFLQATGAPAWAGARARAAVRELVLHGKVGGVEEATLLHELAHVVFREWVGFEDNVPLWLDEGVAAWLEARLAGADLAGRLPCKVRWPVEKLAALANGDLATSGDAASFYAQAADLVAFLLREGGSAAFLKFCRQLRAGKTTADALRFAYPEKFRSIADMDAAWRKRREASLEDGP